MSCINLSCCEAAVRGPGPHGRRTDGTQPMTPQPTRVDLLSLEDFQSSLDRRLDQVDRVLGTLRHDLADRTPALGAFEHARTTAHHYEQLRSRHIDRLVQLRTALTAAQQATAEILHRYRSAEERNAAGVDDIAARLHGVGLALGGSSRG